MLAHGIVCYKEQSGAGTRSAERYSVVSSIHQTSNPDGRGVGNDVPSGEISIA